MASRSFVTIRPRRPSPILVCKKCLTRLDDGKHFKRALKSELKDRCGRQNRRRPRVVLTGCFGICPKRAVVLASGATLTRGEYVLAADGEAMAQVAAALMPDDLP